MFFYEKNRSFFTAILTMTTVYGQTFESLYSPWPNGEPNTDYAQYFIGNSYLANVGGGMHNVTFEPRCRNNWHIHHKQVQVLICVAGRGWYQEWGKKPVERTKLLRPDLLKK